MKKSIFLSIILFLTVSIILPNVYAVTTDTDHSKGGDTATYNIKNTGHSKGGTETTHTVDNTEYKNEGDIPEFLEPDDTVSCGKIKNIPSYIPFITSLTITVLTIISMGMLVIMGTIDLFKGTVSGKDDEIKKNQKAFVGRLTSAILLFLLVALTKILIGLIGKTMGTTNGIAACIDLFINNR